jgi:hypothetical protein
LFRRLQLVSGGGWQFAKRGKETYHGDDVLVASPE